MPLTTSRENTLLDAMFSATTYIGASTTTITKVGGNVTEPSDEAYVRATVLATSMGSAGTGAITNIAAVAHDEATESWGTITDVAFYDAASGGTPFAYGVLAAPKAVGSGEILRYAIGEIDVAFVQPA